MDGWLSYRAADFLLFSERVYWRLFERLNQEVWPLPGLIFGAVAVLLVLSLLRPVAGWLGLSCLLAVAWISSGWIFVWQAYGAINWIMPYVAPVFLLQGVILLWAALRHPTPSRNPWGYVLMLSAVLWPGLACLFDRSLSGAEVVGIAPDPTAVATLGAALFLSSARWMVAVMIVPALWLLQSTITLWVLSGAEAWPPALALGFGGMAAIFGRRTPHLRAH